MPGLVQETVQRDGELPTVVFYGTASPCSNFHPATIEFFGHTWPTSEHLFMAWKAKLFSDEAVYQQLKRAKTPAEAKKLGRTVTLNGYERFPVDEWNEQSYQIMVGILQMKFLQNKDLKKQLLEAVVDEHGAPAPCKFAEVTKLDHRWGTGCDLNKYTRKKDTGTNHLGKALTEVRNQLLSMESALGRVRAAGMEMAGGASAAGAAAAADALEESFSKDYVETLKEQLETSANIPDDTEASRDDCVRTWSGEDWRTAIAAVGAKRRRARGE